MGRNHSLFVVPQTRLRFALFALAALSMLTLPLSSCSKPESKQAEGKVSVPKFDPDNRPGFPSTLTFGIVPQQAADAIKRNWAPLAKHLSEQLGREVLIKTAPSIPEFEQRVAAGHYDLSYMNPYHYTVFAESPGYRAFARQEDKRIHGIVVVREDSPVTSLSECANLKAAFPSPAAFAASLLTRAKFKSLGIPIDTNYVKSHDSVYAGVARGIHSVGGGVKRTLAQTPKEVREQLRVLWTTPGFTPHAFAYHPRVPEPIVERLKAVVAEIHGAPRDPKVFERIKFKGLMPAVDTDWDDVRTLGLRDLAHLQHDPK